jgi:hypothetical protein
MSDIEITYDGHAIGQLISGPDHEMIIHYMPYRSLSHYVFCRLLETKQVVTITIGKETFTVLEIVKAHYLRVSRADIS